MTRADAWLRWPYWRPRYEAVIVGRESGIVTALSFVRFRSAVDAWRWCVRMNNQHMDRTGSDPLTYYDFRTIERE